MAVKALAVRRTDSLYAQLGGKANIAAIVDRFYEKMLADPDIRPLLAKANLASLKTRQSQYLTQALGGPADAKNRVTAPAHAHLLTQARHVERATTHLALALSELNMAPDLVDGVMERVAYSPKTKPRQPPELGLQPTTPQQTTGQEELLAELAAVSRSYAVAEFQMDGTLLARQRKLPGAQRDTRSTRSRAAITASSSTSPTARARNTANSGTS